MKQVLNKIKKINILSSDALKSIEKSSKNSQELFYNCHISIFEDNNLNHKDRLSHLKLIRKLQTQMQCNFSMAHNFSLSSKVEQELNQIKNAIKSSNKSHELFKKEYKNNELALNGSVFAYANLANIYSNLSLDNIALEYLYKGKELAEQCTQPYIPSVRINMTLGAIYSKVNKIDKSINIYEEIYSEALKRKMYSIVIPALVNLSSAYTDKGNYKKGIQLNNEALDISNKTGDTHYKSGILSAIGKCYEETDELKQALNFYQEALKINEKNTAIGKINSNQLSLACLLIKMGNENEAINYLEKIIKSKSNEQNLTCKMNAYKKLADIFENQDLKISNKYYKKYISYYEKDYINKKKLFTEENKHTIESLELYIDNIQKEKENEKLKLELETQRRELITKKVKTLSENKFLTDLIIELKKNMAEDDGKIRKKINRTIELLKDRIDSSSDWKQFLDIFNDLNPTFINTLEIQCPDLSDLEIRVAAMIKFGLHTREIANILSVTIRGIEQHRYRIKKKLSIDENLTTYLRSI